MAETNKTESSHVLADPSAQAVAKVYAQAYLDSAAEAGVDQPLEEFTSFQDDILAPNPDFARLLTSPLTTKDEKLGVIERAVKPHASEFFTNFLKVLGERDRLELLPLILRESWLEQERRDGKVRVQVRSAQELSDSQREKIEQRVRTVLNKEPILVPSVESELLGGIIIQVGDTIYDGSLRTRLKKLQSRLRERYLNEIQSGRDRFSLS